MSHLVTKPTKWHVWSEYLLCAQWVAKDPSFLHVESKDSDQTGWMPRLIWVFADRKVILLVLSWGSSNIIIRKGGYLVIIKGEFSIVLHKNIYCWYSLKSPQQGDSNEYQQRFYGEITKIIPKLSSDILPICHCEAIWHVHAPINVFLQSVKGSNHAHSTPSSPPAPPPCAHTCTQSLLSFFFEKKNGQCHQNEI